MICKIAVVTLVRQYTEHAQHSRADVANSFGIDVITDLKSGKQISRQKVTPGQVRINSIIGGSAVVDFSVLLEKDDTENLDRANKLSSIQTMPRVTATFQAAIDTRCSDVSPKPPAISDKTGPAPRGAAVDRNVHGSTFDLENTSPEAVVLPGSTSTVALASTSEVFSKDFIDESPSLSMDLDMDKQTRLPPLVTAAEYFPTPSPSTTTTTTTTTSDAPPLDQLSSDLADFLAEDEVNSTKLDVAGVTEFSTSADKYRQNER